LGIVTTSSETTFKQSPEAIYDFVSNPANWTKTYFGGPIIRNLPDRLPLEVGDTWDEAHPDPQKDRVLTWQLAIASRPTLFVFSSVGRVGHDSEGNGGLEGRMTIETSKHAPLTDGFFRMVNPTYIDSYHAAVARELER
jgi:hypothetical protein